MEKQAHCCDCRREQNISEDDLVNLSQKIDYGHFPPSITKDMLKLDGDAQVVDDVLRLTEFATNQHGAAWFIGKKLMADGFVIEFDFRMDPKETKGADGFAFVIQDSADGLDALGEIGEGIGYQGIDRALAVEFDTFFNPALDTGLADEGFHVSVQSCGTERCSAHHDHSLALATGLPNAADGNEHSCRIAYSGKSKVFTVELDKKPILKCEVNFNGFAPTAYLGWTASTGAEMESHDILRFSYYYEGHGYAGPNECDCGCHGELCQHCQAMVPVRHKATHSLVCSNRTVVCQYCAKRFPAAALADHETTCFLTCPHCLAYPVRDMQAHEGECVQRTEACQHCGAMVFARNLRRHSDECRGGAVVIPCPYCKLSFAPAEIKKHRKKCDHRLQQCTQCNLEVPRVAMTEHMASTCLQRSVKCNVCKKSFSASTIGEHSTECSSSGMPCAHCGTIFPSESDVNSHQVVCEDRWVSCDKCLVAFRARAVEKHSMECSKPLRCRFCSTPIFGGAGATHEGKCELRKLPCGVCGTEVLARELDGHQFQCENKIERCPHCKAEVRAMMRAAHEATCPERMSMCVHCGNLIQNKVMGAHATECGRVIDPQGQRRPRSMSPQSGLFENTVPVSFLPVVETVTYVSPPMSREASPMATITTGLTRQVSPAPVYIGTTSFTRSPSPSKAAFNVRQSVEGYRAQSTASVRQSVERYRAESSVPVLRTSPRHATPQPVATEIYFGPTTTSEPYVPPYSPNLTTTTHSSTPHDNSYVEAYKSSAPVSTTVQYITEAPVYTTSSTTHYSSAPQRYASPTRTRTYASPSRSTGGMSGGMVVAAPVITAPVISPPVIAASSAYRTVARRRPASFMGVASPVLAPSPVMSIAAAGGIPQVAPSFMDANSHAHGRLKIFRGNKFESPHHGRLQFF